MFLVLNRTGSVWKFDSLESHPDTKLRKTVLEGKLKTKPKFTEQPSRSFKEATLHAAFQAVEAAYAKDQYDMCMYLALKLRQRFPGNAYLTAMIGKVFLDLCERKDFDYDFRKVLPQYTIGYNDELRLVNDFLNNLKGQELGEIGFHFMSEKKNFDPNDEEHYYLLWKASCLTNRNDTRKKVKSDYDDHFEKQKYKSKMLVYTPYRSKFNHHNRLKQK